MSIANAACSRAELAWLKPGFPRKAQAQAWLAQLDVKRGLHSPELSFSRSYCSCRWQAQLEDELGSNAAFLENLEREPGLHSCKLGFSEVVLKLSTASTAQ